MTATHPEGAAYLTGAPTAWPPHPPEQPHPPGWAEAGRYAWYVPASPAYAPAPHHVDHQHPLAPPYPWAGPPPGLPPETWHSWHGDEAQTYAPVPQDQGSVPQSPEWSGRPDPYPSSALAPPQQTEQGHYSYLDEELRPPGAWYAHHPPYPPHPPHTFSPHSHPQDVWYGPEPQVTAPGRHVHTGPAGLAESDDIHGAPSLPEPEPDAEREAAGPAAPRSRRAGSRRVAVPGAGSGRRRAARGPSGSGRRRKQPASGGAARAASTVMASSGLAMVLFVVHQVWWSNVQALAEADGTRAKLEQAWNEEPGSGTEDDGFAPGEGFAVIRIPKLDLAFPIAEGTGTEQVLDKGLVGHYSGTGMPADAAGNFVLAAHRNTHGEPFREIGRLTPGDRIVVETASATYTYEVAGRIPETPPSDVSVLQPVPGGSPFTVSGRYITLTTCTPEYSTRGRLIVFGELVEERPRARA